MSAPEAFAQAVEDQFRQIRVRQATVLEKVAGWIAEALMQQRFWYVFGTGHSHLIAEEGFYRAGGLARVIPILEENLMLHRSASASTEYERRSGVADGLLVRYPITAGDLLLLASNSGRNSVPIDLALAARERGVHTVALTNLAHSRAHPSRHPSGRHLADVCDVVIDTGGCPGDAAVELPGLNQRMGPTSSLAGIYILHLLALRAAERLLEAGQVPEVFRSSNADGESENARLIEQFRPFNPHL